MCKKCREAKEELRKVEELTYSQYDNVRQSAYERYKKKAITREEYEKTAYSAYQEWDKVTQPARQEYVRVWMENHKDRLERKHRKRIENMRKSESYGKMLGKK